LSTDPQSGHVYFTAMSTPRRIGKME